MNNFLLHTLVRIYIYIFSIYLRTDYFFVFKLVPNRARVATTGYEDSA